VSNHLIAGRYELGDQLGAGGMGVVHKGTDVGSGEIVAIKKLKLDAVAKDPAMAERFRREAAVLRSLNHPNIVTVLESCREEDSHYIIMEYIRGGSLHDLLQTETPLRLSRILEMTLDLADALTRAHRLKIIHRDIKPANVLLTSSGSVRLTDFGVAMMWSEPGITDAGTILGTLPYQSPEACSGLKLDTRTDIWSFGVLLFEMLAGRRPFSSETPGGTVLSIMNQPMPDLEELRKGIPVALADLIYRMLERDREARLPSIRLVGAELESILQGDVAELLPDEATEARPGPSSEEPRFAQPTIPVRRERHNLPPEITPFVGRDKELPQLAGLLSDPYVRLVTILAPGGMGKTRLAQEVALDQLDTFSNGAYLVPLAPVSDAEYILPAIAEAVRFPFQEDGREPKQQLIEYFQAKKTLLVLDNFEHLIEGGALISEILQHAPQVKILVTSRERLNLQEETVFRIDGMSVPSQALPDDALQYSAIQLFLLSARRLQPGLQLEGPDSELVIRICRAVQGVPLGIILAASWVETLSLQEISEGIGKSFDFLESDMRNLPERHRSIRHVFDTSWSRLSTAERDVYMKLSVFRGGFTREAVQEVTLASLRTLMGLVNKSLLHRDPHTGRYRVHELARQYAEEKLRESGQAAEVGESHARFYLRMLEQRGPDIKGRRQLAGLNEIETDLENIRAAWVRAVESGDHQALNRVLEALHLFSEMRGRQRLGRELIQLALDRFAAADDSDPHPVFHRLQVRNLNLSDPEKARSMIESCLAVAELLEDKAETAYCISLLGSINFSAHDFEKAIAQYEKSIALYRELGDIYFLAKNLGQSLYNYAYLGHSDKTMITLQQSIDLIRTSGDKIGMAGMFSYLGLYTYAYDGDYNQAADYQEEARTIAREMGDQTGFTWSTITLSRVVFLQGDFTRARALAQEGLDIATDLNLREHVGFGLITLGWVACMEENYTEARHHLVEARRHGSHPSIGMLADWGLGMAGCGLQDFSFARRHLRGALDSLLVASYVAIMTWTLPVAAVILAHDGDKEEATRVLSLALNHPKSPTGWSGNWALLTRLHEQLKEDLGPERHAAAWEKGRNEELIPLLTRLAERFKE